jgi:uncharacterized protein (TIGR02265 family)
MTINAPAGGTRKDVAQLLRLVFPRPKELRQMPFAAATPKRTVLTGSVKGTLVVARMKYLRAQGTEASERVLKRLSQADQAVLRGMLLPSTWYPVDLLLRLEMTIAAILAQGDRRALFLDMGHFSADTNLGPGGVQRPFLREGDPQFLLQSVPRMYAAQHSAGARTYERTGPRGAVIRTIAGEDPDAEDCLTAVGWLKRAIELSGGRAVTVSETQCRARAATCCEYACSWT